jgi:uncharacterized membrane protein
MAEERLASIERHLDELYRRIEHLEGDAPESVPATGTPRAARPPRRERAAASPPPARIDLEELLGGRVLAWLGGIAIVFGIVFFLGMAISRGWIDEPTRTVLAMIVSSLLVAAGVWLYERKGRAEAALAAAASGLTGLFGTLLVATQLYDLLSFELGLAAAALVSAVAVVIAVRWESTVVGAIGILGALVAPILVGADVSSGTTFAFVAVALVAAVAVLLWQRWDWLALGAFAVSTPQLIAWTADRYEEHLTTALAVLAAFWVIYLVAAIGYELRVRTEAGLPIASWLLLLANMVLIAGSGYAILDQTGHEHAAVAWIIGLAGAHVGLGAAALRLPISREIGSLLIAAGLGLSAIGFADALDGPALVAGWAVQAIVLAHLAAHASAVRVPSGSNAQRLLAGSAAFLGLAFGHALMIEAPPSALLDGVDSLGEAAAAIGAPAAAALLCAALWRRIEPELGAVAAFAGAAGVVYLASVTIIEEAGIGSTGAREQAGQVWLSIFWALTGLGAILAGLFRGHRAVRLGGLALLGLAIAKVYSYDLAELDELARVLSFIALGLFLLVGAFAYQRLRGSIADAAGSAR